jgi:hypothetical protein
MSVEITEDELFAELDKLRECPDRGLTEIQFRCLDRARIGENPIAWNKLVKWFNEKFGTNYSRAALWNKYDYMKGKK